MTQNQLSGLSKFLQKDWQVFALPAQTGPQNTGDFILIDKIKKFFIPGCEDIFEYQGEKLKARKKPNRIVLLGLNILDLEAILLYDLVFKDDPYYQSRRQNILIIANNAVPSKKNNFFGKKFSPISLKKLPYDIFLIKDSAQKYKVVVGSNLGKKILNTFGYKRYKDLSKRLIPQPKLFPEEKKIQQAFIKNTDSKIWQDLAKRCLECGKCTLICPTCFCFRIDDQPAIAKNQGKRSRCWDSCFYHDFSEIAGGHKFLKNTEQRIRFWYGHKFARIPQEYGMLGCTGCGRCTQACPVNIDIGANLKKLT